MPCFDTNIIAAVADDFTAPVATVIFIVAGFFTI
jgi:hypothetical protein